MIDAAMSEQKNIKNMAQCLAKDLTWCLSAKFEQQCVAKSPNAHKSSIVDNRLHFTSVWEESKTSMIMDIAI